HAASKGKEQQDEKVDGADTPTETDLARLIDALTANIPVTQNLAAGSGTTVSTSTSDAAPDAATGEQTLKSALRLLGQATQGKGPAAAAAGSASQLFAAVNDALQLPGDAGAQTVETVPAILLSRETHFAPIIATNTQAHPAEAAQPELGAAILAAAGTKLSSV